jgi:hypothetical protein
MNNYKNYEKAISIIKVALPYVRQIHDDAECSYDTRGDDYMDHALSCIMQDAKSLLYEMVKAQDRFYNE